MNRTECVDRLPTDREEVRSLSETLTSAMGEVSLEQPLSLKEAAQLSLFSSDKSKSRTCSKCRKRPVYLDIKNMDWCEQCIWEHVRTDQTT